MAKIDRNRKIEKIISANGMVLLEKNYRPETWIGLLNVIDMNHEKFDVHYVADVPTKPKVEEDEKAVWREDQLREMNFKRLSKIATGMEIDISGFSTAQEIKNAILKRQEETNS